MNRRSSEGVVFVELLGRNKLIAMESSMMFKGSVVRRSKPSPIGIGEIGLSRTWCGRRRSAIPTQATTRPILDSQIHNSSNPRILFVNRLIYRPLCLFSVCVAIADVPFTLTLVYLVEYLFIGM